MRYIRLSAVKDTATEGLCYRKKRAVLSAGVEGDFMRLYMVSSSVKEESHQADDLSSPGV